MNARQLLGLTLVLILSGPFLLSGVDNALVLHDATPVRLRINRNLSSADATVGETVDFEVLDDIKIGDTLIVARGGTAIATVTQAQKKRRMGRGGKLDVNIDYVRAVNGDKIALRAVKEASGGGHVCVMTGAIVATSLVFFPAAPFFLFMHGKDITIPKGTEITAYSNGEIKLDPEKFAVKQAVPAAIVAVTPIPTGPKLTNADIVALKEGGLSDDVIIAKIKTSPAGYALEVNDLMQLKKANISEAVITAMIQAPKQAVPVTQVAAPPPAPLAPGAEQPPAQNIKGRLIPIAAISPTIQLTLKDESGSRRLEWSPKTKDPLWLLIAPASGPAKDGMIELPGSYALYAADGQEPLPVDILREKLKLKPGFYAVKGYQVGTGTVDLRVSPERFTTGGSDWVLFELK